MAFGLYLTPKQPEWVCGFTRVDSCAQDLNVCVSDLGVESFSDNIYQCHGEYEPAQHVYNPSSSRCTAVHSAGLVVQLLGVRSTSLVNRRHAHIKPNHYNFASSHLVVTRGVNLRSNHGSISCSRRFVRMDACSNDDPISLKYRLWRLFSSPVISAHNAMAPRCSHQKNMSPVEEYDPQS
jgi:hypothetical protein